MDHMNLSDELRSMLIESAAWAKADIAPARLDESSVEEVEELEEKKSCGSKSKKAKKAAGPADDAADTYGEDVDSEDTDAEELEESEEVHVCPLCVSQLDESIDEDRILDHLNVVMGLVDRLSQINEGDEDIESVIADAVSELLLADDEDEA